MFLPAAKRKSELRCQIHIFVNSKVFVNWVDFQPSINYCSIPKLGTHKQPQDRTKKLNEHSTGLSTHLHVFVNSSK